MHNFWWTVIRKLSMRKHHLLTYHHLPTSSKVIYIAVSLTSKKKNSEFSKTGSHANLCVFGWGIHCEVTFRQGKMLLSILKHYTLRCGCKSKRCKWCKCKKMKGIAPSFSNQRIMRNLIGYLKKQLLSKLRNSN